MKKSQIHRVHKLLSRTIAGMNYATRPLCGKQVKKIYWGVIERDEEDQVNCKHCLRMMGER